MIKIQSAEYCGNHQIQLTFSDGAQRVLDLHAYRSTRKGPLLDELEDENLARQCYVDTGALCWPNGLELAPAPLYELQGAA
ncbi:MAG: DUF2442 domain-containing protein [Pseudohongiellaceae bacterium]